MDDLDRAILDILVADGRASVQSVADRVGLKRPAVHARIQRMEAAGVIRGVHASLSAEALGMDLAAFVFLQVSHGGGKDFLSSTSAIVDDLGKIPGVLEVHTLAGDDDMMIKVRARNLKELEDSVLRRMSGLSHVTRVRSRIVLSTRLERPLGPSPWRPAAKRHQRPGRHGDG